MSKASQKVAKPDARFVTLGGRPIRVTDAQFPTAYNTQANPLLLIKDISERASWIHSVVGLVHTSLQIQPENEDLLGALLAVDWYLKESKQMLNILSMQAMYGGWGQSHVKSAGGTSC